MPKQIQKSEKPSEIFKVPTSRPSKQGIKKKIKKGVSPTSSGNTTPPPLQKIPKNKKKEQQQHPPTTTKIPNNKPGEEEVEDDEDSELSFSETSESTHDSALESSDLSSSVTDESTTTTPTSARQMTIDPKTITTMQNKIATSARKVKDIKLSDPRGSIYIGHLPWGFFEKQLKKFFSQFGIVTGINMPRSKKTGNFKHFAFVEFLDPIVAKIAAETMNGYIMFSRTLDVRYIPPEQSKTWFFRKHTTPRPLDKTIYKNNTNKERTKEEIERRHLKLLKKESKTRKKLMDAGIDCWDFPGFKEERRKSKVLATIPTEEPPSQTAMELNETATTLMTTPKESPAAKSTATESPAVKSTVMESPTVKTTAKESPAVKMTTKESPAVKVTPKESPDVKMTPKESPAVKTTAKESPDVKMTPKESTDVKMTPKQSPAVKTTAKESPDVKMTPKESPVVKTTAKESPAVKSTVKESPTAKTTVTVPTKTSDVTTTPGNTLKKKTTPRSSPKQSQKRKKL